MTNLALALLLLQEHDTASPGLMSIQLNLMFWTLIIFVILWFLLQKFAFPAILGMVEKREQALEEAIQSAKRDREEAARILAEHRSQLEGARGESQRLIADARAVAEKMRAELLEKTRQDQQDMIERARRDIGAERDKAIVELRREAVDLAIAGASKVVEENLDNEKNRKLVESFLSSLATRGDGAPATAVVAEPAAKTAKTGKNGKTGKR
jgi:F-type H+-transporting ATPase subunit b